MLKEFGSYKNLPNEAKYLVYAAILPSVGYGMFYTDISYFLTKVQGVSPELMGIVITAMGVSTFVASILLGIAADVYGKKKLLVLGNILASTVLVVFALTTNPGILLGAAIIEGIAEAAVLSSSSALLAEKANNRQRNSVFSLYGFAQGIAYGAGSIAIPAVLIFEFLGFSNQESHVLLYIVIAMMGLFSTLLLLKVSESKNSKRHAGGLKKLLPGKSKEILIKYILTGAIIAFGAGLVVPLMTWWFDLKFGISDAVSGFILGISSILIGIATLAASPLAKRFGLIKAIVMTQAASTVFMVATPLFPNFISASVVYGMRALLMNMSVPLQQSMIMGLVAQDERGAASGISGALWRLPNALSTFVGAWIMGMGLLAEPFFIAGLFYMISIMMFWYYFRRTKPPEEE